MRPLETGGARTKPDSAGPQGAAIGAAIGAGAAAGATGAAAGAAAGAEVDGAALAPLGDLFLPLLGDRRALADPG